jgi:hypothetical protein
MWQYKEHRATLDAHNRENAHPIGHRNGHNTKVRKKNILDIKIDDNNDVP